MSEEKHAFNVDDFVPSDEAIMQTEAEIQKEVAKQDLIGKAVQPPATLLEEYKANPKFVVKIEDLVKNYSGLRRVRGDGNCFYRAYLFGCMQFLATSDDAALKATLVDSLTLSKDKLIAQGISEFIVEDFWDNLMNEVNWIQDTKPPVEDIVAHFNEQSLSDYLVSYARLITSSHLKTNADAFSPYLGSGQSMAQFLASDVEPMGKDADYVQCVALTNEFGVPVRVEYLDQSDGALNHHDFPEGQAPRVFLLYRPGHYDVVYPK